MSFNRQEFLNLRKNVIEKDFDRMNNMQKEAVFSVDGSLLVLAGAGSGKTTVIVNRIANIIKYGNGYNSTEIPGYVNQSDVEFLREFIENKFPSEAEKERAHRLCSMNPCNPWNIIAITFTNKAAGELKERLNKMLGEDAGSGVWASTFHSACVRILRREIENIGYNRNFTIYDSDDSLRLIKDCMKEQNVDDKHFTPKSIQTLISNGKNELLMPDEFADRYSYDYRMRVAGEIYKSYQQKLKNANALDFDDLIMKTVMLFREHEDVLKHYSEKFKYVLVDEYQDTNHSQYMLVNQLSSANGNICVVGDDDQSIYKFRGATIENILSFDKRMSGTKTIRLEQNYRSASNILEAANRVIEKNKTRNAKVLWTNNEAGEKITRYHSIDDQNEAMYIANTIMNMVKEDGYSYNDFGILYRINAQSGLLERTFSKMALPHKIIGGVRFYDRKEIKDILAYLNLIVNNSDDLRLKRIINEPKRGIGVSSVDLVEGLSTSLDKSMFEILGISGQIDPLMRVSPKLSGFYRMISGLISKKDMLPLNEFVELVINETGYKKALEIKDDMESRGRIENIMELVSNALSFMSANENATLESFLEEVALVSAIDNHDPDADAVSLMTVHSAKGLEFPVVFIYGIEEGIFPSMMSSGDESEMEEERRLCYVAITRAKKKLFVTHSNSRFLYGKTIQNQLSRFAQDIPENLVEIIKPEVKKLPNDMQTQYKTSFANHQSMFQNELTKEETVSANTYVVGLTVEHVTFGKGMIVSLKKMANDTFLEVAFEKVGTKKLMANFAKLKVI